MITYKQGDLFSTTDKIIAHGCNCHGVMGSGVAKRVKELYPWAFEDYQQRIKDWVWFEGNSPAYTLGKVWASYSDRFSDPIILHCITQNNYGKDGLKYVSYDAIDRCMQYISEEHHHTPISMPKIGAGLGGGHWPVIEAIINHRLRDQNVTIWTGTDPGCMNCNSLNAPHVVVNGSLCSNCLSMCMD